MVCKRAKFQLARTRLETAKTTPQNAQVTNTKEIGNVEPPPVAGRSYTLNSSTFSDSFLRLPQVLARVPVARSTLWAWVREGRFPKPVKLGPMTTAWRASDVCQWLSTAGERAP